MPTDHSTPAAPAPLPAANDNAPGEEACLAAMQALVELMARVEARRLAGLAPANVNTPPQETTP